MALSKKQTSKLVSGLKIYNRQTKRVSYFDTNQVQDELLEVLQQYNRVIVLKARRFGISTLIRAWQYVNAMTATEPHTYALLAHTKKASQEVNKMDKRFYDNFPKKLRPSLSKRNTTTMTFKKSGATLEGFTAGGKGGTRAFEAYMAHLSEFAFYDDQEETLTTVLPTVGDGQVVIESTPDCIGDKFHELCMGAIREDGKLAPGPNGWVLMFFPWYRHPEYQCDVPENFRLTTNESKLKQQFSLSNRQLAWRRKERATLGAAKFKREYPATIEEAFQAASDFYIDREAIGNIKPRNLGKRGDRPYGKPDARDAFVMGVDVSEGIGKDSSAISIVSLTTRLPVYHYRSNEIPPAKLAEKIVALGRKYNNPLVIVESNNDGKLVLHKLGEFKYKNLFLDPDSDKAFRMTVKTRPMVFGLLRELVEDGMFEELEEETYQQLKNLVIRNGRPDHPEGGKDDIAVSLGLCYYALKDKPLVVQRFSKVLRFEQHKANKRAQRARRKLPASPTGGYKH